MPVQNFTELRLYSQLREKICYDFQPVKKNSAPDWVQWEAWHSYPNPLRIYLTDFEQLLRKYVLPLFPSQDACDGSVQQNFDPCFDNWLSVSEYHKLTDAIRKDTIPPEQTAFYQAFLQWLETAMSESDIIVIESNL